MGRCSIIPLPLALVVAAAAALLATEARPFHVVEHNLIMDGNAICAATKYSSFCDNLYGPDPQANLTLWAIAGVNGAVDALKSVGPTSATLQQLLGDDPEAVAALTQCLQIYKDALPPLNAAHEAVSGNNYAAAETDVRLALLKLNTCITGLSKIPAAKADELFSDLFDIKKMLRNTLTVAQLAATRV